MDIVTATSEAVGETYVAMCIIRYLYLVRAVWVACGAVDDGGLAADEHQHHDDADLQVWGKCGGGG